MIYFVKLQSFPKYTGYYSYINICLSWQKKADVR